MSREELLKRVLSLPVSERAAFLDQHCHSDSEDRIWLERKLKQLSAPTATEATREVKSTTEESLGALDPSFDLGVSRTLESGISRQEVAGSGASMKGGQIGPYDILEVLGEGGMGTVFLAEQKEPVARRVALKVIKVGANSRDVLARFEAERQAMAMMNHVNIARILDAGTTPDGRPFFAMELVQGVPFTEYCDGKMLGINERLRLFAQVCDGVQHAHQKGIIHRDLKPSNVLVEEIDGKPVPKVIDFGLAKAIQNSQRLTDHSLFTGIGQILGTLKYMSPEQASLDSVDIDTRTDVYSLGVMLYEVLTGTTPLDEVAIKRESALQVLQFIREREPTKPSSKLSSFSGEQASSITIKRRIDVVRLNRILAGDLDWITMKALEKDRERRYETVSGFSADINRYLGNEPVTARPPSLNYRVRKFVRKHRYGVAVAVAFLIALLLGLGGTITGLIQARSATILAEKRLDEAEEARKKERQAKELALVRLSQVAAGNEILTDIFADLDIDAVNSSSERLEVVLGQRLFEAYQKLDLDSIGDRRILAEMQFRIGRSLFNLGWGLRAHEILESAHRELEVVASDDEIKIESAFVLARAKRIVPDFGCIPLLESVIESRMRKYGPEHRETVVAREELALVLASVFGSGMPERYANRQETLDLAFEMLSETAEINARERGPADPMTLNSLSRLATVRQIKGELEEASEILEAVLAEQRVSLGSRHWDTVLSIRKLSSIHSQAGNLERACELYGEAVDAMIALRGAQHSTTQSTINMAIQVLERAGRGGEVLEIRRRVAEQTQLAFGDDDIRTLDAWHDLAESLSKAGQISEAIEIAETTLKSTRAVMGDASQKTRYEMDTLARLHQQAGNHERALELFQEELVSLRQRTDDFLPDQTRVLMGMAHSQHALGESVAAANSLVFAYDSIQEVADPEARSLYDRLAKQVVGRLIGLHTELGNSEEAARWRAVLD